MAELADTLHITCDTAGERGGEEFGIGRQVVRLGEVLWGEVLWGEVLGDWEG